MITNRRFTIRSKMTLGNLLIALVLAISIFIVTQRISTLQHEIDYIAGHDIDVHDLINEVQKSEYNMESGQRGYIITGNTMYLDMYGKGSVKWVESFNDLMLLISDNPSQQQKLRTIGQTINTWITVAGEPSIKLKKEYKTEELVRFFKDDPGKKYIDQIRSEFNDFLLVERDLTENRAAKLKASNDTLVVYLYLLLVLVVIITLVITYFFSGSIVRTIKQVVFTISNIASADGKIKQRIIVSSNDEIRDLGDATNELLSTLDKYNWLQTSITSITGMYQGITDLKLLAESFISKVTPMVEAKYGVVYLRVHPKDQSDKLNLTASYAAYGGLNAVSSFEIGEGLIGQCALEKQVLFLNDLPDHYLKIASGIGQTSPLNLMIVPIMFGGKVIAVVEFGSLQAYDIVHRALIERIKEGFGNAIHNVTNHMNIEKLLSDSQALAEELQIQSEELQSQSEELQMQQEELRMTNEHLEEQNQIAEQKTFELEKVNDELESITVELRRSSKFKSDFLANMSHELRTPLNSILILSQMLADNENKTLNSEEEQYSHVIHEAGKDLLLLIDDILDLSKVEAGKIDILINEVNVTEIPEVMKQNFSKIALKKGLAFKTIIDEDVKDIIQTDGQRLNQILKNLLSNAFKFTESGSVTLYIRNADPARVNELIDAADVKDVIAISVVDTGIGIPVDKQRLIFDAFQQVDGTMSRQFGGTGLGLSICREFSRLLGGVITLESEENKGSDFTLYLPSVEGKAKLKYRAYEEAAAATSSSPSRSVLAEAADSQEKHEKPSDTNFFKGKRVLLVDDDARNTYAIVAALENKSIDVVIADNGKECLSLLEQDPHYDLILMDIMMPVMDGYETMQTIRKQTQFKGIPIIALTAKAMKNDREKCLEAGASDYISKPLNIDQLFSLMRVWLCK